MATILRRVRRDGSVGYTAQVRLHGYPKRHKTFDRKTDAMARGELHLEVENIVRDVSRLQEPEPKDRVLSLDEQREWLEVCRSSSNPGLYALAALLCATGARIGDLEQLRWRDLHLEPGKEHLVIRRGSAARATTKNRMIRAVPIGWQPAAVEALRAHQARAQGA